MRPTAKCCARCQPVPRPSAWIPCTSLTSAAPSAKMVSGGCKARKEALPERSMVPCSALKNDLDSCLLPRMEMELFMDGVILLRGIRSPLIVVDSIMTYMDVHISCWCISCVYNLHELIVVVFYLGTQNGTQTLHIIHLST